MDKPTKATGVKKDLVIKKKREDALLVQGNYDEVKAYLTALRDKYADIELTEENMELVRGVKAEMRTNRVKLEGIEKDIKRTYFNDPKKIFMEKMEELYLLVGQIESKADAVLSKQEQERVDNFTQVLQIHKDQLQEHYQLPDDYLDQVIFKKQYYNKTQKESDTLADLEKQFEDQQELVFVRNGNINMIRAEIGDNKFISMDDQVSKLDMGIAIHTIVDFIQSEKERINKVSEEIQETQEAVEAEVVLPSSTGGIRIGLTPPVGGLAGLFGIEDGLDLTSDFKREDGTALMKTTKVVISYPVDIGPQLTLLFTRLKEHGVEIKPQK